MPLKGFDQKMSKVVFQEDYSSCAQHLCVSECTCVCVCSYTGPGGDSIYHLPTHADVDGKNPEVTMVVHLSLEYSPYQGESPGLPGSWAVSFRTGSLTFQSSTVPETRAHSLCWSGSHHPQTPLLRKRASS